MRDLSLDVPNAPALVDAFKSRAIADGVLPADAEAGEKSKSSSA